MEYRDISKYGYSEIVRDFSKIEFENGMMGIFISRRLLRIFATSYSENFWLIPAEVSSFIVTKKFMSSFIASGFFISGVCPSKNLVAFCKYQ